MAEQESRVSAANAADLDLISKLAREAGEIGMRFFGRDPQVWTKEGDSPVSEADFAIDRFLKEKLLAARPDYGWISEETADDRPPKAYKRSFIIDPIDGTRGFISNNPQWCVSVAVAEAGRPVAGALDCPALNEHYKAAAGGKAWLNGAQAETGGGSARPPRARISCRKADLQKLPAAFAQAVERAGPVPSLAYRLALLARGQLDAVFVRPGCHDWDIAAIDVILQGCGAALVTQAGQPVRYCEQSFRHGFLLGAKQSNLKAMLDIVSQPDLS